MDLYWKIVAGALVAAVLEAYEVDEALARRAVEDFLETLRGYGFLE